MRTASAIAWFVAGGALMAAATAWLIVCLARHGVEPIPKGRFEADPAKRREMDEQYAELNRRYLAVATRIPRIALWCAAAAAVVAVVLTVVGT